MKWPAEPKRLPADAPNILITLIDDGGFGAAGRLRAASRDGRSGR